MRAYERARRGIAYVPQGREIFPLLTVRENLETGFARLPRRQAQDRGRAVRAVPGAQVHARRGAAAISPAASSSSSPSPARSSCEPQLLVLDEPTEGIQPSIIKDIGRAITYLRDQGRDGDPAGRAVFRLRPRAGRQVRRDGARRGGAGRRQDRPWSKATFGATLPSDGCGREGDVGAASAVLAATDGRARCGSVFACRDERRISTSCTRPARRACAFPSPPQGAPPEAVLLNTAGGLTGGDRIDLERDAGRSAPRRPSPPRRPRRSIARAMARPDRREAGARRRRPPRLAAAGDHPVRRLAARPAHRGRACGRRHASSPSRSLIFGRQAMGEDVHHGACRDAWRIRRDGALVFADTFRVDGAVAAALDRPATLAGARAAAMLIYVAADAASRLEAVRAHARWGARASPGPARGTACSSCARSPATAARCRATSRRCCAGSERPAAAARVAVLRGSDPLGLTP